MATLVEKQLGRGGRRRHIPVLAMKLLPPVVRLFDERAARLMTLGTSPPKIIRFRDGPKAADRFGVRPRTLEEYVSVIAFHGSPRGWTGPPKLKTNQEFRPTPLHRPPFVDLS